MILFPYIFPVPNREKERQREGEREIDKEREREGERDRERSKLMFLIHHWVIKRQSLLARGASM